MKFKILNFHRGFINKDYLLAGASSVLISYPLPFIPAFRLTDRVSLYGDWNLLKESVSPFFLTVWSTLINHLTDAPEWLTEHQLFFGGKLPFDLALRWLGGVWMPFIVCIDLPGQTTLIFVHFTRLGLNRSVISGHIFSSIGLLDH